MKQKLLLSGLLSFLLFIGFTAIGQGLEDFTNSDATSSYGSSSFVGNDGITWSYVASRDGNGDANNSGINLPALMLRRSSDNSAVSSESIGGGIGNFSVKLYKGFTGAGDRQVELFVNGISYGTSTPFDDYNEHLFEVNNINVAGNIIIEIVNTTSKQVIVDDITWTGFTGGGNVNPLITNIVQTPSTDITSTTTVSVSADVTDSDGTITGVELNWTTDGITFNPINMTLGAGDTYTTVSDIPAQSNGTMVSYFVYAIDNEGGETFSPDQSYTVSDPATATLPYSEDFTTDFGNTYAYSVSGATKVWSYNSGGYVVMNGYNSGDVEEDWLVLPGINLNNSTNEVFTFESWKRFGSDDANNYLKLYYSTNYAGIGDPTTANWTELSFTQPTDEQVWTSSGNIDLSGISGTNVRIALKYRYESGSYRWWQIDNLSIVATQVDDPTGFTATANGTDQIDLTFTANGNNDNVVIVYNADGNFTAPSGAVPAVGQAFAGGTVLYNGNTSPQSHTGLNPQQTVYYKAFSVNGSFFSAGVTADATTEAIPAAGLLLEENFDYTNGDLLTDHGWTAHSGGTTNAIDVTDGLFFPGYAGSGFGGAALLDNTGQDVNKTFPEVTGGVIYTAFLVNTSASNSAGYFLHLGQTVISSTFFTRVWVNATGDGLGIGSSTPASYVPITPGQTTLVVTKLDYVTKESSLFVFNSFPAAEPATAAASFTETANYTNVGSVALRQFNAAENVLVDGIRVATTWADAVAAGGGNIPPAITNIVRTPAGDVLPTETVNVAANVTDSDGTVQSVTLHWGLTSGNLTNSINMTLTSGSTYSTVSAIPAQTGGSQVFYAITATDNDADQTTSPEQSYTVTVLDPSLVLAPSSLSGFTYEVGQGPSASQTYTANGYNFVGSGIVTVSAPASFEVSIDNQAWNNALVLQYQNGGLLAQPRTIYVRMKAGLTAGNKNENIAHADVNIGTVNLPVSGTVTSTTPVANIAALRAGSTNGTVYELTGEAILTFAGSSRNQKFIQDATGAILIDDATGKITTTYAIGDGITGLTGTLSMYQNMLQLIPTEDPGAASSTGNTVTPVEVALEDLDPTYQAKLVKVNFADFSASGNFSVNSNYSITDPTATGVVRTQYSNLNYIGTPIPETTQNLTGVVLQYSSTMQLIPRSLDDFEEAPIVDPTIYADPEMLSGLSYPLGSGPSNEQSFMLSGLNITGGIGLVTSGTYYEMSLGTGANFVPTNPITVSATNGTVAETPVYVRLKAGLELGNYNNEQIVASSPNADNVIIMLNGTVYDAAAGGGMETFDNLTLEGSSYANGTFLGQDGSTWTFEQSRGDVEITGKALMLGRNRTPQANVVSGVLYGGIGTLNFDYMQAFSTNVNLNVLVNDNVVGNVTSDGEANVVQNSGNITVNIDGPVTIKFISANNTDGQVVIDNIEWTAYEGGLPVAVAPSFDPPAGTYNDPIAVSLTSATPAADIFFSTVGENGPWTAYSAPIPVAEATTLWAYASAAGFEDSPVVSADYVFTDVVAVSNIAALRAGLTNGTIYQLTGEAILTFKSSVRNQKYIQDATGAILIDDNAGAITTSYNLYDGITGITGTLTTYQNMLEFIPTADPGAATSTGNTVTPVEVSLSDLDASYQAKLVVVNLADFSSTGNFSSGTNYPITDPTGSGTFRTQYSDVDYIGTPIPSTTQNITGVIIQYQTTIQLVARSLADFVDANNTDPTISVIPTTLNGFTYEVGSGPSAEQSFTVSGVNLTASISLAAPANYEMSLGTGGSFVATDPITLPQTGGVVAATTVYVRLAAGLTAGTYNGEQIVASSAGATNKTVTLSGTVTEPGAGGLLLVDNFEYANGSNLSDNGWTAHSGAGNEPPTVTGGLSFDGYAGSDIGGAALLDNTGEDVHRTYAPQTVGTVYAAFIVNTADNAAAGYFIHFGQETIGTTYFTRIWVNATGDGLGIGQSAPDTYVPITAGANTLVAMKFDVATQTSSMYVFNSFPAAEPATADAEFVETSGPANVGSIALRQFSSSMHVVVDGIRVATTWADAVAPAGGTPVVASPSFNPPGGSYTNPVNVTISTSTAGATLYYSENSASGPWTLYTAPVNVAEDKTIWAYGEKDGYDNSPVSSATYTFTDIVPVASIFELRQGATDGTVYQLTGEAILTFQSSTRHQKYIQDASAAIMIDDSPGIITTTYDLYDGITGITGTLTLYQNMLEFVPTADPGAPTSVGNTVVPVEVELAELDDSYQAQLVKIIGVDFADAGDFVVSTNYDIIDQSGTGVFRTQYGDVDYIGTPIPSTTIDVTAVVLQYQTTMQIVARSLADFGGGSTDPVIIATPSTLNGFTYIVGNGPSASQSYSLSAQNLVGSGDISVTAPDNYEISDDDVSFGNTLSITFADGVITGQPISVYVRLKADLPIALYEGETITHSGGGAPDKFVTLNGEVTDVLVPGITAEMVPQFIEGINGTNNNRIPFAYQATLSNLEPNATYRFINQAVISTDDPTTNGAGNVIFVNQEGDFVRTSSPNLGTDGAYGTFTTDAAGSYTGWFITEPTGNARFTPGNEVFMRIRLNDGNEGTNAVLWLTTSTAATVITFGTEADPTQGTALRATSGDLPKSFVFLYDNNNRDGRPLAGTSVEATGVAFADVTQYAAFYREDVAGVNGSWGTIIPNVNANGVQLIEVRDLADGSIIKTYEAPDGVWGTTSTVNPAGGIDEVLVIDLIEIGLPEAMAASYKVWNSRNAFVIESNATSFTFSVFNLMGQPLLQQQINGAGNHTVSHQLAAGVYVIRFQNSAGSFATKVIVR